MTKRVRNLSSIGWKVLFASAVLVWMIRSGKLNPREVASAFADWPRIVAIVGIVYAQIGIAAWRWFRLTATLGFGLRFRDALSLTMIGVMFTTVVPGSIGGDVLKAYYAGARLPHRRTQAFVTILIDRYVGLLSLLTLATAGVALNYTAIASNKALFALSAFTAGAFLAGTAVLIVGVFISGRVALWIGSLEGRLPLIHIVIRCLHALREYRKSPEALLRAVLVSLPGHLFACLGMLLALRMVHATVPPAGVFLLIVPLGFITTAVPISPGGIGVGQAAMYTLFESVYRGSGPGASNAFTLYQTLQILTFLTGFVPYFSFKREQSRVTEASAA